MTGAGGGRRAPGRVAAAMVIYAQAAMAALGATAAGFVRAAPSAGEEFSPAVRVARGRVTALRIHVTQTGDATDLGQLGTYRIQTTKATVELQAEGRVSASSSQAIGAQGIRSPPLAGDDAEISGESFWKVVAAVPVHLVQHREWWGQPEAETARSRSDVYLGELRAGVALVRVERGSSETSEFTALLVSHPRPRGSSYLLGASFGATRSVVRDPVLVTLGWEVATTGETARPLVQRLSGQWTYFANESLAASLAASAGLYPSDMSLEGRVRIGFLTLSGPGTRWEVGISWPLGGGGFALDAAAVWGELF